MSLGENLSKGKEIQIPAEGGGDYWIASLSNICTSYKQDDIKLIDNKIDELQEKLGNTRFNRTKDIYDRNISILEKYKKMNLKTLRPSGKLTFLTFRMQGSL